jgi:5-methylcytosine-specific restriction endonuclease McrA
MRYSNHNILVHEPHPQSLAALVLLTKKLTPKEMGYKTWLRYRKWFLKEHVRKYGLIHCHYCNKGLLKKFSDIQDDLATLDHVKPISKGGDRFHSSNLVIACYRCNCRKRDKDVNDFYQSCRII